MSYDQIKSFEQECKEKDAEIERLKALNTKVNDGYEALWEIIREQRKRITELCDALDRYTPDVEGGYREAKELIQRAREEIE